MDSLKTDTLSDKDSISNDIKSSVGGVSNIISDSEAMVKELAKNKANVSQDFTKINEEMQYNFPKLMQIPDYKSQIPKPSSLGVSSDGDAFVLFQNIEILNQYLKIMMTGGGLTIGDDYCLQNGWNSDGSPNYITVNNKPTGEVHIPGIPSYALGTQTNMMGLIPSILEDVWEIDPSNLLNYMKGKGRIYNGSCSPNTEPFSIGSVNRHNQYPTTMNWIKGFHDNKKNILCMIIIFVFFYLFL